MRFLISLCIPLLLLNNVERIDGQTTGIGCSGLNCTEDELCEMMHGVYGCVCKDNHYSSQHDSFDYMEICQSGSCFISLSRCQLFEAGFPSDVLHLNDPNCRGIVWNGRVEFYFDNKDHKCGTNLVANGTHFIYENFILGDAGSGPFISRERTLRIHFSCVYSQTQILSMNLNSVESIVGKNIIPAPGTYPVRMTPYQDAEFLRPFTGNVSVALNQRIFVEVSVGGVDSRQFASVVNRCWATPVNDSNHSLRWNLIENMCPNPNDVEVLQNGVNTSSRISIKLFMFSLNITKVYLHCAIHICLQTVNNNCSADCSPGRGSRYASDFYNSTIITMDSTISSDVKTGVECVTVVVQVSKSPSLCGSLMTLFISMMSLLISFQNISTEINYRKFSL